MLYMNYILILQPMVILLVLESLNGRLQISLGDEIHWLSSTANENGLKYVVEAVSARICIDW